MLSKRVRTHVYLDAETLNNLKQRSIAIGASVSELVRRDLNIARYQDGRARLIEKRARG